MGNLTTFPISNKINLQKKFFFDPTHVNFGAVYVNFCHFWYLYGARFFSKRGLPKLNEILTQSTEYINLTWVENGFLLLCVISENEPREVKQKSDYFHRLKLSGFLDLYFLSLVVSVNK